jgi:hypothetical protein
LLFTTGRYLQSALEVEFNAPTLKEDLVATPSWQYIYNNGITSLFQAYTWSLDIFVDFAWCEAGTRTGASGGGRGVPGLESQQAATCLLFRGMQVL